MLSTCVPMSKVAISLICPFFVSVCTQLGGQPCVSISMIMMNGIADGNYCMPYVYVNVITYSLDCDINKCSRAPEAHISVGHFLLQFVLFSGVSEYIAIPHSCGFRWVEIKFDGKIPDETWLLMADDILNSALIDMISIYFFANDYPHHKMIRTSHNYNKISCLAFMNQIVTACYPRFPSAPTGIVDGHCVRPSVRPSVCSSVPNDVTALTL